ncbi:hypothetical protein JKA73_09975 [Myxococcus xanthus]|uniref:hypothetical protein n=1 Tax=Myxococcus xanthus TaxID=34 RepID=UPI0019171C93|nr:hypothetical protein [Myxococcus xanthus]QQR46384.1 hypothetical protein JKA73_09975 [Myxococcus xanthus]
MSGISNLKLNAQGEMARVGFATKDRLNVIQGEVFTAQAGINTNAPNPDGSVGINIGASATIVGGEVSLGYSGNSATFGMSGGVGFGGSVGIRDSDGDGRQEVCARVSVGPVTLGRCREID